MSKIKKRLKKYTQIFYWATIFIVSGTALFFILPGEPQFKYDYQKGFPWLHENLVAPFDFAILKSKDEIDKEIEEQMVFVVPYFTNDTSVISGNLTKLHSDLALRLDLKNPKEKAVVDSVEQIYSRIYENGILQRSVSSYDELNAKTEVKKRTGIIVSKIQVDKLFTEKTAYNKIYSYIKNLGILALSDLSIEKYISSNLEYDAKTTQKEIDEIENSISPNRGMVQKGERIVLQGEIIDAQTFQILESLRTSFVKKRGNNINHFLVGIGKALIIIILLGIAFAFLFIYRKDIIDQFSKISFLMLFLIGTVFISGLINSFPNLHMYLVPLAIFPIVVRTFFDSRTAIFMLIISTLLIGFYSPNYYEYILLQLAAGIIAVFSLNKMHRRVHLVLASFWVFITYCVVFTALSLVHEGSFVTFDFGMIKWFAISSTLILLVYPLVYIFEKAFGFISDVTLIEISDSNQPLLRKLAEEAPGTFQHSMQIANLAEEVILKIGGNPFLVRAGALYHDIGKVGRPNFFIENQVIGINPHDRLSHLKSAEVIIDHVKNGVKMAQKHKLPEPIIEFIATHHGTTKAKYFYLKHKEDNPDAQIKEDSFIYPGPLPKSKEAAVVMLVDGIEAASRSMKEKTRENLQGLINAMIDQKIDDKQLDHSELTFKDIKVIKETLLTKLINIYHIRIEYPKEEKLKK